MGVIRKSLGDAYGVSGDGYEIPSVKRNLPEGVNEKKNCLIHFNGAWYDVSEYMDKHPGGDVIKEFIGKDATIPIRQWHPTWVFKGGLDRLCKRVPDSEVNIVVDESLRLPLERKEEEKVMVCENGVCELKPVASKKTDDDVRQSSKDSSDAKTNVPSDDETVTSEDSPAEGLRQRNKPVDGQEKSGKNSDAKYELKVAYEPKLELTQTDKTYCELYEKFEKLGYFKGTAGYLASRYAIIIGHFVAAYLIFANPGMIGFFAKMLFSLFGNAASYEAWAGTFVFLEHCWAAFFVYVGWMQSAGIMHDCGHNQYFNGNIKKNDLHLYISAPMGLGISRSFWKWEHIEHHTFTNSYDEQLMRQSDPQMTEEFWYPDINIIRLLDIKSDKLYALALTVQHWVFFGAIILLGRIGIVVDAWRDETRLHEWGAFLVHVALQLLIFSPLYSQYGLLYAVLVYYIACIFQCILSFMLMSNHLEQDWTEKLFETRAENQEIAHLHRHVEQSTNIKVPEPLQWTWGGLNFHIEHHMFPRLARQHLGDAKPHVEKFCKDNGIEYSEQYMSQVMVNIWKKLKELSTQ